MKFACTLDELPDRRWVARHSSHDVGELKTVAASRAEAIEKLQNEIRYRLELCPCSGESYQHIEIEIVTESPPVGR